METLNANEKRRLFASRARSEGAMFLHRVGRIRAFLSDAGSAVPPWLLINPERRRQSPGHLSLRDCQAVKEEKKETVRLLFLSLTSAFKIRRLRNEVMNLITDLSELTHLHQTDLPPQFLLKRKRDDGRKRSADGER